MPYYELQPLRLQQGWKIEYNNFSEYDMSIHGKNDSWELHEDLLQLYNEKADLLIDLGWYPAYDEKGSYYLQLIKNHNWDKPLEWIKTQSKREIIYLIEKWVDYGFWQKYLNRLQEKNFMEKIKFKYYPTVWEHDVFMEADDDNMPLCECCERPAKYYVEKMYARETIDCICQECVASGAAAEKFNGDFVQAAEDFKVNDEEKRKELYCRTPGYISWQGEYWLACCNDYCAYIGDVGTKELEEMGIADEVFEEYDAREEYENAREYLVKCGSMAGYLFQCLHCKKYHLWVDAD